MLNIPQSNQLVTVTVLGDFSASWPDLLFLLLLLEVFFFTFVDCRIRETSNRTVISQKGQGYPKRVWDILCGSNVASPSVTHWSHLWNLSIHVYIILNILLPCSGMKSAPWRVLGACAAPGEGTGCWASPEWQNPAGDVTVGEAVKGGRKAISQAISWFPALCIPAHKPLIHFRMQRSWRKVRG